MIYLQKSQSTNKRGTKVKGCFLLTYAAIVMWNEAVAGLRALQRTMNYLLYTTNNDKEAGWSFEQCAKL